MSDLKMKKFISLFLITCTLLSCNAEDKWDEVNCDYTNHDWHFHWNLNKDLKWELHQGNEPHTVFNALSPYGLKAHVNITPMNENGANWDYWENFEQYKNVLQISWDKVSERTGAIITPLLIEKCRFFGEKAIKVVVKMEIEDDVLAETSYGLTYTFKKDKATWQASVKTSKDIWDLAGMDGIKELFLNFGPNAK